MSTFDKLKPRLVGSWLSWLLNHIRGLRWFECKFTSSLIVFASQAMTRWGNRCPVKLVANKKSAQKSCSENVATSNAKCEQVQSLSVASLAPRATCKVQPHLHWGATRQCCRQWENRKGWRFQKKKRNRSASAQSLKISIANMHEHAPRNLIVHTKHWLQVGHTLRQLQDITRTC